MTCVEVSSGVFALRKFKVALFIIQIFENANYTFQNVQYVQMHFENHLS